MPEKADISRTLLLPFMSIILLVAVYMTANVLLPLKASGKGSKESEDVQERQHLSDDAGDGEVVEMNINFSEKCIVIDSGHGGADPGKVGVAGTNEKEINLAIAKKLQERLEDAQINVIMTRDTDDDLSVESDKSKKKADLERRCDIINSSGADMVISIHQNSYVTPKAEGAQVFYYSHSAEGHTAAKLMQQALLGADSDNTRQEKANDTYYLLRRTQVPTIIVECGFLSNQQEAELLAGKDYQKKIAKAIATGIVVYVRFAAYCT